LYGGQNHGILWATVVRSLSAAGSESKGASMFNKKLRFPQSMALAIFLSLLTWILLPQSAYAQTYTVVYNFTGGNDGANPLAGVTIDCVGNLYGTTSVGGGQGFGTVYHLVHAAQGWRFFLLYTFLGETDLTSDGGSPYARVVIGPDGLLYGTTHFGGDGPGCESWYGCGTVFSVKPGKTVGSWEETVLYRFGVDNGSNPDYGDLVFDKAGNLYGTTKNGGAYQQGTVYEMKHDRGIWTEKVLYSFAGTPDGASPLSGPVFDQAGNLYGTTSAGGANGWGTLYQLSSSGSGWTETILDSLQNGSDGLTPAAGVIFDPSGNLYGATQTAGSGGGGTLFELSPLSAGTWSFNTIYGFLGPALGGPFRSVTMDAAGNLYGTTSGDGAHLWGSVFKLTHSNGRWTYTSLHDFTGGADGGTPYGGLMFGANGNLYGTTSIGGASGNGVVFEITP
jgi:uncharacterized repeat protein (TIGR03803 family)